MVSLKQLNTTAILVLSVSASLNDGHNDKRSFTLHQSDVISSVKSGPAALLSIYQKFNKRIPVNVETAAAVSKDTIFALPTRFNGSYMAPITVGVQTFNVDIDTGSNVLWVFSSEFASVIPTTYNSPTSNTSRPYEGSSWEICHQDQSCVAGEIDTETVSAGGIVVDNQTIGVVTEVNSKFQPAGCEGVLGLSLDQNTLGSDASFLKQLKSALSAPIFTADLKKGRLGSYDFGFIDESKYTGNITYVPVNAPGARWQFPLNGYAIGTNGFNSLNANVTADTGTSLIILPNQIVNAYYAQILDAVYSSSLAGYVFPCGTDLPNISFDIGNFNAVVPGSFIEYGPNNKDGITCFGGIQSVKGSELSILGDIFLKSQFVVFDAGNEPRLGFATKPL